MEITDEIMIITLNRPTFKNAVNWQMMDELALVLNQAKNNDDVKVIIITGKGNSFSSGGDLSEFHKLKTSEEVKPMLEKMSDVLYELENIGKLTIAYVNGYALGGGAEIALACDLLIINDDAQIGFIQIGLGVTTGWGSATRLIQKLGRSSSLYILLSGKIFKKEEILRFGIADLFLSSNEQVIDIAKQLSSHSLKAMQAYIELANGIRNQDGIVKLQEKEVMYCSQLWETPEHADAVNKFLQSKKA